MIIDIVLDIPLEKDSDDYKELCNIFSYIIDCATEIQVACKLIEKKDSIFNERAPKMYLRRFPHDSASVHACAFFILVQAQAWTLAPS